MRDISEESSVYPVRGDVDLEKNPEGIVSVIDSGRMLETDYCENNENADGGMNEISGTGQEIIGGYASSTPRNINPTEDAEMNYFLGRWLAIYTYDIPSEPFINDEENNSYIDIYKENGVYRIKMRRFFEDEWEYSTGILLKEIEHTSPIYFDPEEDMFISFDSGAILSLKRINNRRFSTNEGLNTLLYHNSIYLDHGVEQYFYQRKEVIDDLVEKYGNLQLQW
jgi:hypothetical protein